MNSLPQIPDVLILRLAGADTPAALQSRLAARIGAIDGELFGWVNGRWLMLSGGDEAALAARVAPISVDKLLREAGAAETQRVPWTMLQHLLDRRSVAADFLRDADAQGVAPPSHVGLRVATGTRTVDLDWQLTIAGIHRAWTLFDQSPTAKLAWADLRVGHIDTGVTRHPALGYRGDARSYVRDDLGLNLFATLPRPTTEHPQPEAPAEDAGPIDNLSGSFPGHGTRTLSTLAGFYDLPDDSEPPFYGAAPGVTAIPYRVTDSVFVDHVPHLIAAAMDDAIAKQCRVISISLGGLFAHKRLANAIDRAYEKGVIICAAAGNRLESVIFPGAYNRVVTLGGVGPAGADFCTWNGSARGRTVDVCGPADGIRRAQAKLKKGRIIESIRGDANGTSYAAAICAGIAVLWLAKRGNDLQAAYGDPNWRWVAAFKRLIKDTARANASWDKANWGAGVYQADKLLLAQLPPAGALHYEAEALAPFDPEA